jgi:hypothetical protein
VTRAKALPSAATSAIVTCSKSGSGFFFLLIVWVEDYYFVLAKVRKIFILAGQSLHTLNKSLAQSAFLSAIAPELSYTDGKYVYARSDITARTCGP